MLVDATLLAGCRVYSAPAGIPTALNNNLRTVFSQLNFIYTDSAPGRGVTVLRLGVEPVYRAAIFAGSMMLSSQIAATVSSVM